MLARRYSTAKPRRMQTTPMTEPTTNWKEQRPKKMGATAGTASSELHWAVKRPTTRSVEAALLAKTERLKEQDWIPKVGQKSRRR